ncbi:MAG: hypothetical protein P4L56_06210 [Candidatus Sulfopaludibacter sp.]|nr:hypothetical protein [Candidatus Sulfopaludibacter sp.]
MNRALQLAGAALLVICSGWCANQKANKPPPPPPPRPSAAPNNRNAKGPNAGGGAPKNNAPRINTPGPAQRLLQMTPEERERALEKLPVKQQEQIRQQLERLDRLPQADKDRIARQIRGLDSLPPPQRRLVLQQLNAFRNLPDDRVQPMRRTLIQLMRMPEDQRNARIESEAFKKQFSPQEQNILRDLSNNLPPDYLPGR